MEFNLADLFESAADHFGEREYLVADGTYLVSDGAAVRQARWSVWYWPVMQP